MLRSRRQEPDPGYRLAVIPGPPKDLLDLLGAVPWSDISLPREGECFVYALDNAAGECFYVGKSENLLTRLGSWQKTYGDYLTGIRVLRVKDKDDMEVTELFVIERMQPKMNRLGTDAERRRIAVKSRQAPRAHNQGAFNRIIADGRENVS
jgi:hypothetical protein